MKKSNEAQILRALERKHEKDVFFTHVKNGPTQIVNKGQLAIIDGLAVARSWAHPVIKGYEVKVDRGDFLRDDKWPKYLEMCHEFSFVCPTGLIEPHEIGEGVGLIYFSPEKGTLYTKKKARHRDISPPVDVLWYLVISKLDSDRHPFYSSRREMLEAWVEDREDRVTLGWNVSHKLHGISAEMTELRRRSERDRESRKDAEELVDRINQALKPYGIILDRWSRWETKLKELLQAGGAPDLAKVTQQAINLADELQKLYLLKPTHDTKGKIMIQVGQGELYKDGKLLGTVDGITVTKE